MRMADLFCGAGGASEGYRRAGFDEIVGIDKFNQPEYPFEFVQSDWKEYILEHGHEFDFIHASPVCKGYTTVATNSFQTHIKEISDVRNVLEQIGKPYVIENVTSAGWDMQNPVQVCGSSFKLRVQRHRLFESSLPVKGSTCRHQWQKNSPKYWVRGRYSRPRFSGIIPVVGGSQLYDRETWRCLTLAEELRLRQEAMGIDWMSWNTLTQSIPPAFTKFIGRQILAQIS